MKPNVLKFQSDIKIQVAQQKEKDYCDWWMHPAYCAYYILKHGIENVEECINEDIKRSYKALQDDYNRELFRRKVKKYLEQYGEEKPVCVD
jgi:hypothetical protein